MLKKEKNSAKFSFLVLYKLTELNMAWIFSILILGMNWSNTKDQYQVKENNSSSPSDQIPKTSIASATTARGVLKDNRRYHIGIGFGSKAPEF